MKRLFSFRFKYGMRLFLQQFKSLSYFKNTKINKLKKYAYIFLAADYGNLGDVAITYAQTKLLQDNLGDKFVVLEIPISQSLEGLHFVRKNIKQDDIITTVGGGNLGDMYDQIEYIRQLIVRSFPKNKIISFPQTFDFADTDDAKKVLSVAKKVYNGHRNLYMVAREKTSYELMKKHFNKTNVLLTPDIVISLDKQKPEQKRNGAVLCLRQDKERNLTNDQITFMENEVNSHFETVSYYDTHINRDNLSIEEREGELNKIWDAFRSAELVVTDRLHGMIFCYITNTPCLVFQNNNHKVRETYDWIKGNSNMNLVTDFTEKGIKTFFNRENFNTGSLRSLENKYIPLISILK